LDLVKELKYAKFDETVEVSINLNLKKSHTVRDTVVLPNSFGAEKKILVFTKADKENLEKDISEEIFIIYISITRASNKVELSDSIKRYLLMRYKDMGHELHNVINNINKTRSKGGKHEKINSRFINRIYFISNLFYRLTAD